MTTITWLGQLHVLWWIVWLVLLVWAYRWAVSAIRTAAPSEVRAEPLLTPTAESKAPAWSRSGVTLIGFLLITSILLATEHRAHVLGVLPYALLLLCPLLHLFGHRHHDSPSHQHGRSNGGEAP